MRFGRTSIWTCRTRSGASSSARLPHEERPYMPASDIRRTAGSREECWRRLNGSGRGLFEPVKELRGRIDLVVLLALEPQKRLGDKCVWARRGRCYCRSGVLPANPTRRNASAIASPVAGTELLRSARVSVGRRRFSDPGGPNSVRAAVGLVVGASSSRIVNEIRRRFGSTSNTLTRTTSPGFATLRGSLT